MKFESLKKGSLFAAVGKRGCVFEDFISAGRATPEELDMKTAHSQAFENCLKHPCKRHTDLRSHGFVLVCPVMRLPPTVFLQAACVISIISSGLRFRLLGFPKHL